MQNEQFIYEQEINEELNIIQFRMWSENEKEEMANNGIDRRIR